MHVNSSYFWCIFEVIPALVVDLLLLWLKQIRISGNGIFSYFRIRLSNLVKIVCWRIDTSSSEFYHDYSSDNSNMLCYLLKLLSQRISAFQVSVLGRGTDEKLSARRDKAHVLFGGTKILQHTPDKVSVSLSLLFTVWWHVKARSPKFFTLL